MKELKIIDIFSKKKVKRELDDGDKDVMQFERDTSSVGNAKELAGIVDSALMTKDYRLISARVNKLDYFNAENNAKSVFDNVQTDTRQKQVLLFGVSFFIFAYLLIIGMLVIFLSQEYRPGGLFIAICAFIMVYLDVCGMVSISKDIKFERRYQILKTFLKYHKYVLVEDIAKFSGIESKQVIADLSKAIELKLIPEGHFGNDNILFMTSDDAYVQYIEMPDAYDRYYKKVSEERCKSENMSKEVIDILDQGEAFIKQIIEANQIIADEVVTEKLNRMEEIVTDIFHEVDINPKYANKLGMMLNYYIPTTIKLLKEYIDIIESKTKSQKEIKLLVDIEETLDVVNVAFEKILDKFYEEQEVDILSDITALNSMIQMNGLN